MHDWTLLSISVDWAAANAKLLFIDNNKKTRELVIEGFDLLTIPRRNSWGPSVYVYEVTEAHSECSRYLIEMQSGDVIEIEARSIVLC